jgi:predicted nucleotidyltransferase
MTINEIKKIILPILAEHKIKQAGLFGSIVKDNLQESSDIDILVRLDDELSLLGFVGIKLALEDALGRKVDLVEYDTIKPVLRDQILNEEIRIL